MEILDRIKQLAIRRCVLYSRKVEEEMLADGLTRDELRESIINAPRIDKVLRSRNPETGMAEKLYILKGRTFAGQLIYTKGKIINDEVFQVSYFLISGKKAR